MDNLFNVNPKLRTADEWCKILSELILSLSSFLTLEFEPTSWFVNDDKPGYASSCNCVDVKAIVNSAFKLQACGVLCITINFGEAFWVSCDLLLFTSGKRLLGEHKKDLIVVTYDEQGWHHLGWTADANFEWKSHVDNSRWE